MPKIDVAGLKIDEINKSELLAVLKERIRADRKTFLITPYSEFLYRALTDWRTLWLLNQADIAVPDGIGIFWARYFLSTRLSAKTYAGKIIQSVWQAAMSLGSILYSPQKVKSAFPERISGSELIWDLAALAARENLSIYLLGGFGVTPQLAAQKLQQKNNGLQINWSNRDPKDPAVITEIRRASPKILLVAYGPLRQERWIVDNWQLFPSVKLAVGLGGTFDYVSGTQPSPPQFFRQNGLEWLWRLFSQPKRFKRIFLGTFGLIGKLVMHKVFMSLPYRQNVVAAILNQRGEMLICLRKPDGESKNDNHWMLPQGGIEPGEDLIAAAKREVDEETSIKSLQYLTTSKHVNRYLWSSGFSKNFKGQEQHIVYFLFSGSDQEIKLDSTEPQEFTAHKWVNPSQLTFSLHPLRKNLAQLINRDLSDEGILKKWQKIDKI